jgi:hypothetical protein
VRKSGVFYAIVLLAGIIGLTAQTPSADQSPPPQLPSKPLRSLEYKFQVDYQQNGEVHTGDIGTGGSGVRARVNGIGRTGALDADVLGLGKDGGLAIRVSEWLEYQPRASQSFICAAYPNGSVICPEELAVTDVENTILTFLGRGFYDQSLVDSNHQWTRTYSNKYVSVASTFTITGPPDANPISVTSITKITSATGAFQNWTEHTTFTYDTAMEVPVHIRDVALQQNRGSTSLQTTTEFWLTKDSFAKTTPASH